MVSSSPRVVFLLLFLVSGLSAQQNRVPSQIDRTRRVVLQGRVPRRALAGRDLGRVAGSFPMPSLFLMLKSSPAQRQAEAQLVEEQHNPASPRFHQWLTPEQYADQFGVSPHDVNQIVQWLTSQGFTGIQVARNRMWIRFRGTAQQVETAFATRIDRYSVHGEIHYANASDPSIPADFSSVIASVGGLHDFRWKPRYRKPSTPEMTSATGVHHIAPGDFATIYNVAKLYDEGIDGSGQKLVVVGQTQINLNDITRFRNNFNLPPINLQVVKVPNTPDPGIVPGDLEEADLDIEWASAVARNASIVYVYSDNAWTSAMYAVEQNLGTAITMSYGG